MLFTENDTNYERLYGGHNPTPFVKDAFHDHIIPSHRPPMPHSTPTKLTPMNGLNGHADGEGSGTATPVPETRHFVNPAQKGTKSAAHYKFENVPGKDGVVVVRLKLTPNKPETDSTINDEELFDDLVDERRKEADEFYARLIAGPVTDDLRAICRQALGGMLWYALPISQPTFHC